MRPTSLGEMNGVRTEFLSPSSENAAECNALALARDLKPARITAQLGNPTGPVSRSAREAGLKAAVCRKREMRNEHER